MQEHSIRLAAREQQAAPLAEVCSRLHHLGLCRCTPMCAQWQNHLRTHFSECIPPLRGTWLCVTVCEWHVLMWVNISLELCVMGLMLLVPSYTYKLVIHNHKHLPDKRLIMRLLCQVWFLKDVFWLAAIWQPVGKHFSGPALSPDSGEGFPPTGLPSLVTAVNTDVNLQ